MLAAISGFERVLGVDEERPKTRIASRGSLAWALLWVFPLVMLISVVPSTVLRRIVVPVVLIGMNLGATCLFGRRGLVASAPVLVYGCSAACWVVTFTQAGLRITQLKMVLGVVSVVLVVVACIMLLLSRRTREAGWFTLITVAMCAALWHAGGACEAGVLSRADARRIITTGYLLAIVSAVWLTLLRGGRWVSGHGGNRHAMLREVAHGVAPLAVGCLPLFVVGLLHTTDVLRLAGTLALGYMGLAVLVCQLRPRLDGDLGLLLMPLLLTIVVVVCSQAVTKSLPPYRPGSSLMGLLEGRVFVRVTEATANQLDAVARGIFSAPMSSFLKAVMRKKAWKHMSDLLLSTFCLQLGFFVLCLLVRVVDEVTSWLGDGLKDEAPARAERHAKKPERPGRHARHKKGVSRRGR